MKDQLNNAPAQTTDQAPDVDAAPDHRLPPAVYHQTVHVQPGDAQALADLLAKYPGMQPQILAVASSHAGAATVRQAIELHRREGSADAAPATVATMDYAPGGAFELEGGPAKPAAAAHSEPAHTEPAKPAHAEPAWVAHARKYNAANAALVDEFNDLTNFECTDGNGEHAPDPVDVASWQRAKGLTADGMVGPHTLAAARTNRAKNATSELAGIQAIQADARPPV
jgi:hypothetical protein